MRNISASYIFTGKGSLLKNGIIKLDNNGFVLDVIDTNGLIEETPQLEHYNGIICPGFINAHCHLELSYTKGRFEKSENITGFITQMIKKRESNKTDHEESIFIADSEMQRNGIVACGDISNTEKSFVVKTNSKIRYYNFIEVLGLNENDSNYIINKGKEIQQVALRTNAGDSSISPHASYSLSLKLLEAVKENAEKTKSIISFHNQESKEEAGLFSNTPNNLTYILNNIGLTENTFPKTNKSSLESLMHYLPNQNNILLIHNVFTESKDIELANKYFDYHFWVFCPKSNLFISNTLPNIPLFMQNTDNICVGTDSLSSNNTLSIIEEIKVIQNHFPQISLELLLQWSTINGAKALKMDKLIGSFEKGKKPGVNLIYNLDLLNLKLTNNTDIKVLL
jgi:cytosine/adenosine deaminase-related metal-dependent hydrolase